jgi:transcriptional regulator with XRE-family HTH domain
MPKQKLNSLWNKKLTEYHLAKLSSLYQSTISNIFIRNTAPTIPTIEAICNGLGISMAQFFATDEEESVFLTPEQKELFL